MIMVFDNGVLQPTTPILPPGSNTLVNATFNTTNFAVSLTTAFSNRPGTDAFAQLSTTGLTARNISGGTATLDVRLSDQGFTLPAGSPLRLGSTASGTFLNAAAGDRVTFQSFADPANIPFGTAAGTALQQLVSDGSLLSSGALQPLVPTADFARPGPAFSISDQFTFTLSPNATATTGGQSAVISPGGVLPPFPPTGTNVPEPTTLAVLSAGLVGLAVGGWRRRAATKAGGG